MRDLGSLGGNSAASAVDANIVVGTSTTAAGEEHWFAYDLGAATPKMLDLGTLGSPYSSATAVSGHIVVGESQKVPNTFIYHAFAYDLGAANPKMLDLGALGDTPGRISSHADAVDGKIVVGQSDLKPMSGVRQHAFASSDLPKAARLAIHKWFRMRCSEASGEPGWPCVRARVASTTATPQNGRIRECLIPPGSPLDSTSI